MNQRRYFLKKSAMLAAGSLLASTIPVAGKASPGKHNPLSDAGLNGQPVNVHSLTQSGQDNLIKISFAGYTFRDYDINATLEMMQKIDARYLCIKDFHLPLNSTADEIAAFHAKLAAKNVKACGVGPIYMKTEAEADQAFDYTRRVGVHLLVGVPDYELLPYIDKKVKEYSVNYAIHIHGPDIALYPNAADVINHVKDLDPRIGICLDIGHDTRNGDDPVADLKKYFQRVFDVHLTDVTEASKTGQLCALGRGIVDIPAFVRTLHQLKYNGFCNIELTANKENCLTAAAESIGYIKGVMNSVVACNNTVPVDNQLTKKEQEEGWLLLFDGKTMNGWRRIYTNAPPKYGWYVADGCLVVEKNKSGESSNGGDLITINEYDNFDLTFDFKMTSGANSGIKYFVIESLGDPKSGYGYGLEYQIIDDQAHPIFGTNQIPVGCKLAGLYELIEAPDTKKVNPVGEWNTGRIVSKDRYVEHWLNGELMVSYVLGSDQFKALVQKSKFRNTKGYGEVARGHILIQDHGDKVSYKNIKILLL